MDNNAPQFTITPPPKVSAFTIEPPHAQPPASSAATASGMDLVHAAAPDWAQRNPKTAAAAGAILDAVQGGGREAISQALRLVNYVSPKGGELLNQAIGDYATPINAPGEGTGRFAQQGLEFLAAPGPEAESGLGYKLAQRALSTGAVTALQGGNPAVGAAVGAGGEALSAGARAAAPSLAESGVGIRAADRNYGRTPGAAMLAETTGNTPQTVAASARATLDKLNPQLDQMAANSNATISLNEARAEVNNRLATAQRQNNQAAIRALNTVLDRLHVDSSGNPIPDEVSAQQALDLKRGIRGEFANFNTQPGFDNRIASRAAKAASGAIDNALDSALGPDFADLNQRISNLIPVANRAAATANNAGTAQKIAARVAAHTGALTAASVGGVEGYRAGGLPGALAGATAGIAIPELAGSPTARILAARALNAAGNIGTPAAATLQLARDPATGRLLVPAVNQ